MGKSCLAEALSAIFELPASSKKKQVKAIKPVDQDVGPEVEVDVETGEYRFTYFKRYLKSSSTKLTIIEPQQEVLTGRDAHNRVVQILEETMDTDLWKALWVLQGTAAGQCPLESSMALSTALDRAAGQEVTGDHESSVFDAVEQEYNRYYTETGLEKKNIAGAREAVDALQEEEARVGEEIKGLQDLVKRSEALDGELSDGKGQCAEAERNSEKRQREVKELENLEGQVQRLEQKYTYVKDRADRAAADLAARTKLLENVENVEAEVADLQQRVTDVAPDLEEAEQELKRLDQDLATVEEEASTAAAKAGLLHGDCDFHRARTELKDLGQRKEKIGEAQKKLGQAAELLDRTQISGKLLKQIKEVHQDLDRALARLDAGSPRLGIRALAATILDVDGQRQELARGEEMERVVGEHSTLTVPDLVELTMEAGTSLNEMVKERDKHQDKLDRLLDKAGVNDLEEAERADQARRQAERDHKDAEQTIEDRLGQRSLAELDTDLERLSARVDGYPAQRPSTPPLAAGLRDTEGALEEALGLLRKQEEKRVGLRKTHGTAARRHERLKKRHQEVCVELRLKSAELERMQAELEAGREHTSDEELSDKAATSEKEAREVRLSWSSRHEDLEGLNPDRLKDLAQNAAEATRRLGRTLRDKEMELENVAARLELLGERGLYDEQAEARTRLEHARKQQRSLLARAVAARLLYLTMKRQREDARQAYAAPLRKQIVRLGRYVFDRTFDVKLDDHLGIETRTQDGLELPFDSLSVGAQEQLGHIVRLACALVVDERDGVPLIFDDTLGHTDPLRLEGMGALLSRAGRQCQIIILTCTPGRFKHIGSAQTLSLTASHVPVVSSGSGEMS